MPTTTAYNSKAVLLGTSETVLFQVGPAQQIGQGAVRFVNLDVIPHNVTMYDYDPSGIDYPAESAGPVTTEVPNVAVPARSFIEVGPLVLPPNRKISALCDTPGVVTARPHAFKTE